MSKISNWGQTLQKMLVQYYLHFKEIVDFIEIDPIQPAVLKFDLVTV